MDVHRWPGCESPAFEGSVVTLGVFDGVHLGHQRILDRVREEGRRLGLPSVVVTFDRHPHEVLEAPRQPCITSLEHRLRLFEGVGLSACMVLSFTDGVAGMDAEQFARLFFWDLMRARKLVLGFDARFGKDAGGDISLCRELGEEFGWEAEEIDPVRVDGEIVSSTRIRRAVQEADLRRAEKLLGRPFSLLGTVVSGAGLGRKLGYPTANLNVHNELLPRDGVYATYTRMNEERYASVASVGRRGTFPAETTNERVVEVHVMGMDADLYWQEVEVEFKHRLRSQKNFEGAQELSEQIERDVKRARDVLDGGFRV